MPEPKSCPVCRCEADMHTRLFRVRKYAREETKK